MLKRLFPPRKAARKSRRLTLPQFGTGLSVAAMDLNPFRLCSGLKFLGYFMFILVLGLIAISYDAVIVITCGPHLLDGGSRSFFYFLIVAIFHVLLILLTWSYLTVVFRDPGSVPANWKGLPEEQDVEKENFMSSNSLAPDDNSTMPSSSEGTETRPTLGYCNKCQNGKPPRCHHCSVCQRCVLKMDHHCIWVVNCVGARNYKFFLLFVLYTFLETVMNTLVLLPGFIKFFGQANHHSSSPGKLAITFLAFVLNLAFALSLLCFVVMHTSLLLSNTTSVEVHEKKKNLPWKYDVGWRKNIEQVFGTRKAIWLVPLFSKEDLEKVDDGYTYLPLCPTSYISKAVELRTVVESPTVANPRPSSQQHPQSSVASSPSFVLCPLGLLPWPLENEDDLHVEEENDEGTEMNVNEADEEKADDEEE
ncbi:probable protein s-acyltransferase 12 [Phtheirospermum japonicum]|uniref:S-acyltransferase n=1 Tax=Phtheirospermum japonicum TaxID=374723 RepID=A0A830BXV3_9LAMI|nr:probable protein s-acyltransferase 12 [Phtheirospermum japonicum]